MKIINYFSKEITNIEKIQERQNNIREQRHKIEQYTKDNKEIEGIYTVECHY